MLGRGSYGIVKSDGDNAIKSFEYTSHMIQEYVGLKFINDSSFGIVETIGVDFNEKKITMKRCAMDLRNWINTNQKASESDKLRILRGALIGLCNLHTHGVIHGDLKPGNILVTKEGSSVLGDLGFVAPAHYSKCNYTAASYREKNVVHDVGHDLFSLSIILLEMFGRWRHKRLPTSDEIRTSAPSIKNNTIYTIVCLLVSTRRYKRPSVETVYNKLYKAIPPIKSIDTNFDNVSIDSNKNINNWLQKCGDVFKIKEIQLGITVISDYLVRNKIDTSLYQLYCTTFLMILSSIYGYYPRFNEEYVIHSCGYKYTKNEVRDMLKIMLNDKILISRLLILK